ncbi:MAG: class I SAM-dependent methyltransferase [Kofleriaceae bacterium]
MSGPARPGAARVSARAYYDDFASWYERARHRPYHRMLDELELELVERYGRGRDVVEVGCGTGLLLARARSFARSAVGVDLSAGMLAHARARGLAVAQGSATALPLATASRDVAYCFKVLAHVEDVRAALAEMARVVRPGGWVLAEFYNARSLRRALKALAAPGAISPRLAEDAVYTRYDTAASARRALPPELAWRACRGVRIFTPTAAVHQVPALGPLLRRLERGAADLPVLRALGGFLIVCAQRR